ncbi:MAG: hypothetical protein ACR2NY_00465 [Alphaproteobacteria bacterium]
MVEIYLLIKNHPPPPLKTIIRAVEIIGDKTYITVALPLDKLSAINQNNFTITLSGEPITADNIKTFGFWPYFSAIGGQSYIFSWLYKHTDNKDIKTLWKITALLSAIGLVSLTFLYYRSNIFPKGFSIAFFVSIFFSTAFTLYARNPYWIPFLWFLPIIFALLYVKAKSIKQQRITLLLLYFAFLLKCMTSSYEFLSPIVLMMAAPASYLFFVSNNYKDKIANGKKFLMIFFITFLAFVTTIFIHAYMVGEMILHQNIIEGFKYLYNERFRVRVINLSGSDDIFQLHSYSQPSHEVSYLSVLKTYIFDRWYYNNIIWGISGKWFPWLIFLTGLMIISNDFIPLTQRKRKTYSALFLSFVLVAPSWYILVKPSAYNQQHIYYMAWYFGFIAALFYIIASHLNIYRKIIFSYGKMKLDR